MKQSGITSIAYTLLAAVIVGVTITALNTFGSNLNTSMNSTMNNFSTELAKIDADNSDGFAPLALAASSPLCQYVFSKSDEYSSGVLDAYGFIIDEIYTTTSTAESACTATQITESLDGSNIQAAMIDTTSSCSENYSAYNYLEAPIDGRNVLDYTYLEDNYYDINMIGQIDNVVSFSVEYSISSIRICSILALL